MKTRVALTVLNVAEILKQYLAWLARGFHSPLPPHLKRRFLRKNSLKNSVFIETGTHVGSTTIYASAFSMHVHTIEPSLELLKIARERAHGLSNITFWEGSSQDRLAEVLTSIAPGSDVTFWLDGHWSGGNTFKGDEVTPIQQELEIIKEALDHLGETRILIDDARLFDLENSGYPDPSTVILWSVDNGFRIKRQADMFVMVCQKTKR